MKGPVVGTSWDRERSRILTTLEARAVGYSTTAKSVHLLFWNGMAFDEADFKPVGKHGAAQAAFSDASEIDAKEIRRWLKKAKSDVFDSKAYFKKLRDRKR